ncbi:MAG: hypothetical protein DMC60_11730 [Verrucomicrobia bacterium]|jgi:hypothetical protein|nr:MAG: hypothetical protein DMC60_11730 [Verrucomicrobiota bacterium]
MWFLAVAGIGDAGSVQAFEFLPGIADPGCSTHLVRFRLMPQSTARPIVRLLAPHVICPVMTLSPPIKLSDADKLDVLCRLDQFRAWRSLEEKRYCLVCGKIITGQQIQLTGGTRGNGALRLGCPTERCNSIPMDWVMPTDEILAKVEERMAAEEREAAARSAPIRTNRAPERPDNEHSSVASRLRKFAFLFKHTS